MYTVYRLTIGYFGYGNTDTIGDESGEMGDNLNDIELGASFSAISIDCGADFSCAVSAAGGALYLHMLSVFAANLWEYREYTRTC